MTDHSSAPDVPVRPSGLGASIRSPSPDGAHAKPIVVGLAIEHVFARAGVAHAIGAAEDMRIAEDAQSPRVVIADAEPTDSAAIETARRRGGASGDAAVIILLNHTSVDRISAALRHGVIAVIDAHSSPDELLRAIRVVASGEMYFDPKTADIVVSKLQSRGRAGNAGDAAAAYDELSTREQAVLRLVAEGNTGPEIGRILGITAKSVDTYRHRIQQKIGLTHRRDYINFALRAGLLG